MFCSEDGAGKDDAEKWHEVGEAATKGARVED